MIKHIWSVLCRQSVIDQETNNISLLNILERLSVTVKQIGLTDEDKATIPIDYEIVSFWVKKATNRKVKAEVKTTLISPKREKLSEQIQKLEIPAKIKRMRSRMKIQGFPVKGAGQYIFRIAIKDTNKQQFKIIAEIPLEVDLRKEK
jgi:hypothetical protein